MSNSSTATESDLIELIHPGEILMEDFIDGFGITQNRLAVSIGVPPRRINEIVHGKRGITADTAIRLARYLYCIPHRGAIWGIRARRSKDWHYFFFPRVEILSRKDS